MEGPQLVAQPLSKDASPVSCPICRAIVKTVRVCYRSIPIWNCQACDYCFATVDEIPGHGNLKDLYEKLYSSSQEYLELLEQASKDGRPDRLGFAEKVFFRLFPLPIGKGRLLEVGCGAGRFLRLAGRKSWHAEGVEISAVAAAVGQRSGVRIFCGDLAAYASHHPERRFDMVTAFEVLEHVPDPVQFLRVLRGVLEPSGYLFLSVPNLNDPFVFLDPRPETWPPVHLHFFSRKALRKVLTLAGFRPVVVKANWVPRATMRQVIRSRVSRALLRPPLICLRFLRLIDGNQIVALAAPRN
ncbi:MAG: class I SAM-dependent methyltransferase [Thermoguttaceae bacterium]|nr:class I SAM-dependent methyltransferase [Thermoguttaceae bacterium]